MLYPTVTERAEYGDRLHRTSPVVTPYTCLTPGRSNTNHTTTITTCTPMSASVMTAWLSDPTKRAFLVDGGRLNMRCILIVLTRRALKLIEKLRPTPIQRIAQMGGDGLMTNRKGVTKDNIIPTSRNAVSSLLVALMILWVRCTMIMAAIEMVARMPMPDISKMTMGPTSSAW